MPLVLLILALALPAPAAPRAKKPRKAPQPAPEAAAPMIDENDPTRVRMAEIRKEAESVEEELKKKVQELQTLGNSYAAVPDPRPLFAKREPLKAAIVPLLGRFAQLEDEYGSLRSGADANSVALMINAFVSGKGIPSGMEGAYFHYNDGQEFNRALRSNHESFDRTIAAEETQYKSALHALQVQQQWMIGTSVGGGVLLLLIVGLLFWRHKSAQTAVYITGPTGQAILVATDGPMAALPAPTSPSGGPASAGPTPEPQPGAVLGGNYRVERILGRGGMGVVYEAVDMTLQRKVAIKRMTDELLQAGHDFELFVNEARLVAQLKHPNIVEIHSIVRDGGMLHLVFEYVEGKPLSAFVDRGRRIALKSIKGVVRQTAAALDYAHSRKVIHRDLKPANIMISQGGGVKVMDFGIAHQAKLTVAKMTKTGAWGTPPYMAPEQEMGQVGRESDVFALGVCVYEMATGALPYSGPNFLAQKRERIYKPASKRAPGLSPAFDAVIDKALSPESAARYHTAGELAAALDQVPDQV
ncbi:serine/threonine protein kinase [bacterium]|nr:MAG: serine/threonine protein kinase [bacterium]